jgi:hypothetical protein
LGPRGGGFVKTDKVQDLTRDDAFAVAALLFGNAVRQPANVERP